MGTAYTRYTRDMRQMGNTAEYSVFVCIEERERERETQKKASMISNTSVIRSEADVHYETPFRLYI